MNYIWHILLTKKQKFWQIRLNIGSKQNHCPKITLLSSTQTKNQQDKLQIQPKRLTTKQSQVKTNKTTQIPKIFTIPSASSSLLSASLILSLILSTIASCLAGSIAEASFLRGSLPLSTAQASFLCLSHSFSDSLLSAFLNSQLLKVLSFED